MVVLAGIMWWWKKKQEVKIIHPEIHESFSRVRQDTTALFQWVDYLYRLSLSQHNTISSLNAKTASLHKIIDELRTHSSSHSTMLADLHSKVNLPKIATGEIKAVIDEHYKLDEVHTRLRSVEETLANLHSWHSAKSQEAPALTSSPTPLPLTPHPSINPHPQPLTPNPTPNPFTLSQKSTPLKERILRRISRNSKDYIKGVLRSMIFKYGRISAIQLRDIVVEEQVLCSRSSFYRILDEVETEEGIVCQQDGKEKEYFADPKIIKT